MVYYPQRKCPNSPSKDVCSIEVRAWHDKSLENNSILGKGIGRNLYKQPEQLGNVFHV